MHNSDKTEQNPVKLKGRALEIYLDLCKQADQLPSGSLLPSLRKLQRKYTASQKTVTTALDHLAATRPILRQSRRRARLYPVEQKQPEPMPWSPQHATVTTLGLSGTIAASWQPIIDHFNENNRRRIKPHYVETLPELIRLSHQGEIDFALFHCNPVLNGSLGTTLPFINLKDLVKTIDIDNYYPAVLVIDPQGRRWGISAVLSSSIIFWNRKFGRLPCRNLCWKELLPYLHHSKTAFPELLYPLMLNGYSTFLMQNGVTLVDAQGEIKFSRNNFTEALFFLKSIMDNGLAPLFSDTHYDLASLQWFENGKIAARELFHSSLKHFIPFCPDFDLLPAPAVPRVKHTVFAEFFSICASSLNYATAWDFIKFALSPPIQKILIRGNTVMPVQKKLRPPHLTTEQFEVLAQALEDNSNRHEDYYLPIPLRIIIETAVDRWIKFGGNINDFLSDLEKSCKQQLQHSEVYSG